MRKIHGLFFLSLLACNESSFKGKASRESESGLLACGGRAVLDETRLSTGIDLVVALDTSGKKSLP